MRTFDFSGRAIGPCAVVAVLAGCGGALTSSPLAPAKYALSWMSPESQSGDLLYVSSYQAGVTDIYTFPGGKLVGGLSNVGYTYGLCSEKNGDVFIATEYAVYEYPHGRSSPISIISDPRLPFGCSIDPTSGKLAVNSAAGIEIYRPAGHNQWYLPKFYNFNQTFSAAYDTAGNLFVDGQQYSGNPFFVVLFKGASKFAKVSLNRAVRKPGYLRWDGKYFAIGASQNLVIHRFAMHGSQGTQIGLVRLDGVQEVNEFWIQGSSLIASDFESTWEFGFWKYPSGGTPTKTITQSFATGVTVSLAPQ